MALLVPFVLLAYLVLYSFAFSIPRLPEFLSAGRVPQQQKPLRDTLDAWIEREERIALEKLLDNVKPGGRNVEGKGVVDGTVVASPSTREPDYWFQCSQPILWVGEENANIRLQGFETQPLLQARS